ncbi:MAG: hypothetical protein AAF679_11125, partial [Pseudomonadota bacterium]
MQYLALAGLRLEQTLQDVVDSNPFLTVSNTHGAHEGDDWMARLAAPGPDTLQAALRALAQDLFWRIEDRALANLLIDEVAETGLLAIPLEEIERPPDISLERLSEVRAAFLAEGGLLADHVGQSLLAQAQRGMKAAGAEPRPLRVSDFIKDLPEKPGGGRGGIGPQYLDTPPSKPEVEATPAPPAKTRVKKQRRRKASAAPAQPPHTTKKRRTGAKSPDAKTKSAPKRAQPKRAQPKRAQPK